MPSGWLVGLELSIPKIARSKFLRIGGIYERCSSNYCLRAEKIKANSRGRSTVSLPTELVALTHHSRSAALGLFQ